MNYLDSVRLNSEVLQKKLHLELVKLVKLQLGGFISAEWLPEDTVSPVPWCSLGWPWSSTGWFQRHRAVNDSRVGQGVIEKGEEPGEKDRMSLGGDLGTEPVWERTKPSGKASSRETIRY